MNVVYRNHWFAIVESDGFHFMREHNASNGAVILAIVNDAIVLVEQYRPAIGKHMIELPRGYGEAGELSIETAARELREETGYVADPRNLRQLGKVAPNGAVLDSEVDLYTVDLGDVEPANTVGDEVGRVMLASPTEVKKMITAGGITDSFTIAALSLYLWC
jgi:ADP-ribose pyrophosphatase